MRDKQCVLGWLTGLVLSAMGLSVLYLLGIGPASWALDKGWISWDLWGLLYGRLYDWLKFDDNIWPRVEWYFRLFAEPGYPSKDPFF